MTVQEDVEAFETQEEVDEFKAGLLRAADEIRQQREQREQRDASREQFEAWALIKGCCLRTEGARPNCTYSDPLAEIAYRVWQACERSKAGE